MGFLEMEKMFLNFVFFKLGFLLIKYINKNEFINFFF